MSLQFDHSRLSGAVAILDALGDAISIQDVELNVLYQNRKHIELMGDRRGELCYRAYQKRDSVCPDCHLVTAMEERRTKLRVTTSDYSRFGRLHAEIIASPLFDSFGSVVAGIEVVRDITERKLQEDRLQAATLALEEGTCKLTAANRELETFNYTISHDIRNYLSRISLTAETLELLHAGSLNADGRDLVGGIIAGCGALEELIEAILRLSAIGRKKIDCNRVDLGALADEVATDLRALYPDHPVAFSRDERLEVVGDSQLVKVLLRNLLGNAWKFTRGIRGAKVSLTALERDGKRFFVVSDNGPGFPPEETAALFEPFSRLSNVEGIPGLGIGLATVKRIVLCHGGEVRAEGAPGKGAAIYFTLPVRS